MEVIMLKTKIKNWMNRTSHRNSNSTRLQSIQSQAGSLKMVDQKRASETARLECCAMHKIQRLKTEQNALQQKIHQPNKLFGNQKSLIAGPAVNSAGN
jgi:hypothetical protein